MLQKEWNCTGILVLQCLCFYEMYFVYIISEISFKNVQYNYAKYVLILHMIPVYIELLPWQNFTIATFVVMATSNVSQDAVIPFLKLVCNQQCGISV